MNRGAWSAPNSASDTMDAKSALVRPDGTGTRIVHCRQPLIEDVIVLLPRVIGRHDHHLRPLASVADQLPHRHRHSGLQFQVLRGDSVPQDLEQPLLHLLEAGELLYGSAAASQGISSREPLAGLTGEPLEERPLRRIGLFRRGSLLQALPDVALEYLCRGLTRSGEQVDARMGRLQRRKRAGENGLLHGHALQLLLFAAAVDTSLGETDGEQGPVGVFFSR
jgi:hypothetical protein